MQLGDKVFITMDDLDFQKEFNTDKEINGKSGIIQQVHDVEGHKVFQVIMSNGMLVKGLYEEDMELI
jgi:hypothetical protein